MTEEFNSARRIIALLAVLALTIGALAGCAVEYYDDTADTQSDYYEEYYEDESEVLFDEFEDLQFWGQWHDLAPYGWVWRPTVVLGWRPYGNGHWLWSDLGWTWVSYEPFGWATYHYGFWAYDFAWGWVWIPGYDWYPSRVDCTFMTITLRGRRCRRPVSTSAIRGRRRMCTRGTWSTPSTSSRATSGATTRATRNTTT